MVKTVKTSHKGIFFLKALLRLHESSAIRGLITKGLYRVVKTKTSPYRVPSQRVKIFVMVLGIYFRKK